MNKSIFIATAEPNTGRSIISLGLMNMLLSKLKKIGYFKPIINADPKERKDVHIETILNYVELPVPYADTYAFTREDTMKLLENGNTDEIIGTIIGKYKKLEEQ